MKVKLHFLETHGPLFVGGVNYGVKFHADNKKNKTPVTQMYWDSENDFVVIVFQKYATVLKTYAYWIPECPKDIGVELTSAPLEVKKIDTHMAAANNLFKSTAQVWDPTKEVQQTTKRKAKFQGEESQGE